MYEFLNTYINSFMLIFHSFTFDQYRLLTIAIYSVCKIGQLNKPTNTEKDGQTDKTSTDDVF